MRHQYIMMITALLCISGSPVMAQAQQPQDKPVSYKEFHEFANQVDIKKHTLSLQEFVEITQDNSVIIADLREKKAYDNGHIKNALHIGPDITIEKLAAIAPDKKTKIVFYCANSLMQSRLISQTHTALPQALYLGYENAYILEAARDESVIMETLIFEPEQDEHDSLHP